MHRTALALAAIVTLAAGPLAAASPQPWPWLSKAPADPALAIMSHVEEMTAATADSVLSVTVKAVAPSSGFSELQLVPRLGDPKDRIFAFDVRGRAPQEMTTPVLTPVTVEASYAEAPIANLEIIEVYAKDNCLGYSVSKKKPVDCTSKAMPQAPSSVQ